MSTRPTKGPDGASPDDQEALDRLYSAAYEELRRLAAMMHRRYPSLTLNRTALVHEVYLKLSKSPAFARTTPGELKGFAVNAMREVLIDAARRVRAHKRGGQAKRVTFDETALANTLEASASRAEDLLELDDALKALAELDPSNTRIVRVVELRFFGELGWAEIATTLGVSESTVRREWSFAKGWLLARLRKSP
jgi:RNA polymerase sigma factor (TIGR02999 family)